MPGESLSAEASSRRAEARRAEAERRRQWELGEDARLRPPDRRSGCDAPASTGAPQICIRLLGPRVLPNGSERRFRLEWRNLPETVIELALERAAPAGERWRYRGTVGLLPSLGLGSVSGEGAREGSWNGLDVTCNDQPGYCQGVEIGTYRFSGAAIIVEPTRRRGQPSPVPITWTLSDEFEIGGSFDMRSVLYEDRIQLGSYLQRRLGFHIPFYNSEVKRAPMPARRGRSGYCADAVLPPPLRGTLRTCIPARFVDRIGVAAEPEDVLFGGEIGYLPDLVTQSRAVEIARGIAMRGYERAADHIGYPGLAEARRGGGGDERDNPRTWLDTYMRDFGYRHEGGGYWLVVVDQMVKTLAGEGPAGPWDRLLVRIEPNGRACLVGRGPVQTYNPGIRAQRPPGGMTLAQARPNYDPARWSQPCRPARR